jgi:hypothetical protein
MPYGVLNGMLLAGFSDACQLHQLIVRTLTNLLTSCFVLRAPEALQHKRASHLLVPHQFHFYSKASSRVLAGKALCVSTVQQCGLAASAVGLRSWPFCSHCSCCLFRPEVAVTAACQCLLAKEALQKGCQWPRVRAIQVSPAGLCYKEVCVVQTGLCKGGRACLRSDGPRNTLYPANRI